MAKREIEIKSKFMYQATNNVVKSAADQTLPKPPNESQSDYQKKSVETLGKKLEPFVFVMGGATEKDNFTGLSIPLKYKNSLILGYLPESVSLFFYLAYEQLKSYSDIKNHIEKNYKAGEVKITVPFKNTYYQKFFAHSYSVIIFLSTALEAAVNEALPEEVKYKDQIFSREIAERKLSLLDKYKIVLLQEGKISNTDFQRIVSLQKMRDNIIHYKTQGKDWTEAKNLNLFQDLIKLDLEVLFHTTRSIISIFHKDEIKFLEL